MKRISRWAAARTVAWLTYADVLLHLERRRLDEALEGADALVAAARVEPYSSDTMIDFDTGRLVTPVEGPADEFVKWLQTSGADAVGSNLSHDRGLVGFDMIVQATGGKLWENLPPMENLKATFEYGTPGRPVYMTGKGDLPATYLFRTREGGIGILQITGCIDEEPRGVKIRYRMAIDDSGTPRKR